jgi:glyoxylase-like metal-dependent hydrolase (beta-lactamase superfamily II)
VNVTFAAAPRISGIDTKMIGREMVTSAYLLHGDEPALIETGPSLSREAVGKGLAELGIGLDDLAHVVVTHIHLDHAGGVGTLARAYPRAAIWVHQRGAPHLVDPTRLVSSVERVYGAERARAFFGGVEPTPADRLRAVDDGDVIAMGGRSLEVLYTPGHASHHVALVDSETGAVFAGDAIGVHLPDVKVLRPATPPPDIDVELMVRSIERIRDRARSVLLLSHFGAVAEVQAMCALAILRIRGWAEDVREALGRTTDVDEIAKVLEERVISESVADAGPDADMERYEMLSSVQVNAMGLIRYWRKRWERAAAEGGASAN